MYFMIYRKDKPGMLHVRLENHARHVEYLAPFTDKILLGGPTLGSGTGTDVNDMTGGLIIIDVASWDEVDAFVANDPFTKAGLFATTVVERWKLGKHKDATQKN
jgi:uncharacterized protein YciI